MRNNLLTLIFGLTTLLASAQVDTTKQNHWQFGINATQFAKQFFVSSASGESNSYVLVSKYIFGNKALRMGLGMNYVSEKETQDRFLDSKIINNQSVIFRLGLEKQKTFTNHWMAYYGVDAAGQYRNVGSVSDSGFDKVTISDSSNDIGIFGVIGVEYKINKYISLATESTYGGFYSNSKVGTEFSSTTQSNSLKSRKGWKFATQIPISLFLNVKF